MTPEQIVEATLFASQSPLTPTELARADEGLDIAAVRSALQSLRERYDADERAFQVYQLGDGFQLLTRPEFAPYLERFDTVPRPSRLSGPSLETLAIIAYRQPIGRLEIEYIRGVSSAGVIRTLQDRGLIDVVGRAEGVGRPLLYGTTSRFLEHFGFWSLDALPTPEELPIVLRERTPLGLEDDQTPTEAELERQGQVALTLAALPAEEGSGSTQGGDAIGDEGDPALAAASAAEPETPVPVPEPGDG